MPNKDIPIKKKRKISELREADVKSSPECEHKAQHHNHICYLARRREIATIVKLADKPKHICLICGRVANKEEWLCAPIEMM